MITNYSQFWNLYVYICTRFIVTRFWFWPDKSEKELVVCSFGATVRYATRITTESSPSTSYTHIHTLTRFKDMKEFSLLLLLPPPPPPSPQHVQQYRIPCRRIIIISGSDDGDGDDDDDDGCWFGQCWKKRRGKIHTRTHTPTEYIFESLSVKAPITNIYALQPKRNSHTPCVPPKEHTHIYVYILMFYVNEYAC